MARIYIDKPYVILVEGKLDEIILKLILNHLRSTHSNLMNKIEKTQIINIGGKDKLRSEAKVAIRLAIVRKKIEGLLIILDKDDNYQSTEQRLINFLNNFPEIQIRDYLIIPDENSEGQELEDYLVVSLRETDENRIQILDECIRRVSNQRKIGKKLFFTYLLINDNCSYDGLSISEGILGKCVNVENLNLIKNRVLGFLGRVP